MTSPHTSFQCRAVLSILSAIKALAKYHGSINDVLAIYTALYTFLFIRNLVRIQDISKLIKLAYPKHSSTLVHPIFHYLWTLESAIHSP
jgi:hypothetical protein